MKIQWRATGETRIPNPLITGELRYQLRHCGVPSDNNPQEPTIHYIALPNASPRIPGDYYLRLRKTLYLRSAE